MPERVRLALPMARQIVTDGIYNLTNDPGDNGVARYACTLMGDPDEDLLPNGDPALDNAVKFGDAAFCLGVACGLLMHIEAFKDGAR